MPDLRVVEHDAHRDKAQAAAVRDQTVAIRYQ
jgi:hypothetical protein